MLKTKIKDLPTGSGIYQFLDAEGIILYVGKAKNLRNRVKSYFAKEIGRGPAIDPFDSSLRVDPERSRRIEIMVKEIGDIKIIETESEIEAVILEADLIGKIKPKYNIRQKDDKSFLMVRISKEDFPRVSLVRYKNVDLHDKTAAYFGPYPGGLYLKKSLRYLRRIFPFIDCTKAKYNRYSKFARACLYGDIGICPAFCKEEHLEGEWGADTFEVKEYQKNITYLKKFLRGGKKEIIKKIKQEMAEASKLHQFEKAAILRDRVAALEHIGQVAIGLKDDFTSPGKLAFPRIEGYDISNISGQHAVGSMVVFVNGQPDKDDYRKFKITYHVSHSTYQAGDVWMMNEVLDRRFNNNWSLPDLIVIDGGVANLNIANKILSSRRLNIPVVAIAKGPKRDKDEFHYSDHALANYIRKNQELRNICLTVRNESHRFAQSYYRKLHSKSMLNQ